MVGRELRAHFSSQTVVSLRVHPAQLCPLVSHLQQKDPTLPQEKDAGELKVRSCDQEVAPPPHCTKGMALAVSERSQSRILDLLFLPSDGSLEPAVLTTQVLPG